MIELGSGSFPLGAMENAIYLEHRVKIGAGDLFLIYSDGLVEAMSPHGEQFGWDRLRSILENLDSGATANEIRDLILRTVWDFKGDAEQIDDVTMVVAGIT